jgi:hypothetical protein
LLLLRMRLLERLTERMVTAMRMNSSASAVRRETFHAPVDQMSLWGTAPVLTPRSGGFVGRVMLEVWSDGAVNSVGNPTLFDNALGILQHGGARARSTRVAIASGPILGTSGQADFVGRVIVEFWTDGAEVAVLGGDESRLVEHAIRGLSGKLAGS